MRCLILLVVVVSVSYAVEPPPVEHDFPEGDYKIKTTYGCEEPKSDVCGLYAMQSKLFSKVGLDKEPTIWHVAPNKKHSHWYQIYRKDGDKKRGWTFEHTFSGVQTGLLWKTFFKITPRGDGYRIEFVSNCHLKGSYSWPCGKTVDFTSSHYLTVGDGEREVNFNFIKSYKKHPQKDS